MGVAPVCGPDPIDFLLERRVACVALCYRALKTGSQPPPLSPFRNKMAGISTAPRERSLDGGIRPMTFDRAWCEFDVVGGQFDAKMNVLLRSAYKLSEKKSTGRKKYGNLTLQ